MMCVDKRSAIVARNSTSVARHNVFEVYAVRTLKETKTEQFQISVEAVLKLFCFSFI